MRIPRSLSLSFGNFIFAGPYKPALSIAMVFSSAGAGSACDGLGEDLEDEASLICAASDCTPGSLLEPLLPSCTCLDRCALRPPANNTQGSRRVQSPRAATVAAPRRNADRTIEYGCAILHLNGSNHTTER